jgi:hypothetical protein
LECAFYLFCVVVGYCRKQLSAEFATTMCEDMHCFNCDRGFEEDDAVICCEAGQDQGPSIYCRNCSLNSREKKPCKLCDVIFCDDHGHTWEQECCGEILCGLANSDRPLVYHDQDLTGCAQSIEEHPRKRLTCGHFACNLYKQGASACRTCDNNKIRDNDDALFCKDQELLTKMLPQFKSKQMKRRLSLLIPTRKPASAKRPSRDETPASVAKKRMIQGA